MEPITRRHSIPSLVEECYSFWWCLGWWVQQCINGSLDSGSSTAASSVASTSVLGICAGFSLSVEILQDFLFISIVYSFSLIRVKTLYGSKCGGCKYRRTVSFPRNAWVVRWSSLCMNDVRSMVCCRFCLYFLHSFSQVLDENFWFYWSTFSKNLPGTLSVVPYSSSAVEHLMSSL